MTEKRLVEYKVLCDEYDEVTRILFEINETGEEIEGHYQIHEWVNNLYAENEQLKSKLEESKKAHSNCDKLWWELHDEKEQLEKENEQLKKELKVYRKVANCSNCHYHNYDWFDDGDEFEVCDKGNNEAQMDNHFCKDWEEL